MTIIHKQKKKFVSVDQCQDKVNMEEYQYRYKIYLGKMNSWYLYKTEYMVSLLQ